MMARASPSFCRCANDRRPPPIPTGESRPDGHDAGAQPELIQQLGDQLGDPLRRLGLAVGDLAEDHVLLDRDRLVVFGRVEEGDGVGVGLRQVLAEVAPRRKHLVRELRGDQAEPMAGGDQLEGRRQQQPLVVRRQAVEPGRIGARVSRLR